MHPETIRNELRLLWRAHLRAGLMGKMRLYSAADSRVWPAKTPNLQFWFGPDEIDAAVSTVATHFNNGNFPYTPLLLDPLVYQAYDGQTFVPVGSAVIWASALGLSNFSADKAPRLASLNAASAVVSRAEFDAAGLKILAFSSTPLPLTQAGVAAGCRELYDLANIKGDDYWHAYLLSGLGYLSNTGVHTARPLRDMLGLADDTIPLDDTTLDALIERHTTTAQTLADAAHCWERYDRHHTLYTRFGNDVAGLDKNLRLYDYCARDFQFFDSVGPESVKEQTAGEANGGFDFLVNGLIPRGSIVLLAGTGGTGKSSIAHKLCCLVATDWRDDEQPLWLGQPINKPRTSGICIYFSGEDGPAIIHARNQIFDPEGRAKRLMFQRTHFTDKNGEESSFADFLGRLKQMPEVPLLVIDPARKYLTGDEDDSAVVSEFFEAIEKFAHERNTAVIVVHHLSKGAKPKSARDVVDELRGSQVFIDRPRVVIGMFREGPKTIVGLGKCNIPPSLGMVIEERVFAHNPKTLDLTQLPGKDGVRAAYIPVADEE